MWSSTSRTIQRIVDRMLEPAALKTSCSTSSSPSIGLTPEKRALAYIGLNFVREAATLHGGAVRLENAPETGTTAILEIDQ